MTFPPKPLTRILVRDEFSPEEATVISSYSEDWGHLVLIQYDDGTYEYLDNLSQYTEIPMPIEVWSKRDNEPELTQKSWEWLQSTFGSGIRILTPSNPTTLFKIVRIDCIEGPATTIAVVLGPDGKPIFDQPVALSWPDPDNPAGPSELPHCYGTPSFPLAGLKSVWSSRGVTQYTGPSGDTGYGFGGGFVIKDGKGPGTLWVLSPTYPSEALTGIGWLGSSNHWGPNKVYFQIVDVVPEEAPEEPPVEEPMDTSTILALLSQIDTATAKIRELIGA